MELPLPPLPSLSFLLRKRSTTLTNVVLLVKVPKLTYYCHSLVLEIRSPVFAHMLQRARGNHAHNAECFISRCKYILELTHPFEVSQASFSTFLGLMFDDDMDEIPKEIVEQVGNLLKFFHVIPSSLPASNFITVLSSEQKSIDNGAVDMFEGAASDIAAFAGQLMSLPLPNDHNTTTVQSKESAVESKISLEYPGFSLSATRVSGSSTSTTSTPDHPSSPPSDYFSDFLTTNDESESIMPTLPSGDESRSRGSPASKLRPSGSRPSGSRPSESRPSGSRASQQSVSKTVINQPPAKVRNCQPSLNLGEEQASGNCHSIRRPCLLVHMKESQNDITDDVLRYILNSQFQVQNTSVLRKVRGMTASIEVEDARKILSGQVILSYNQEELEFELEESEKNWSLFLYQTDEDVNHQAIEETFQSVNGVLQVELLEPLQRKTFTNFVGKVHFSTKHDLRKFLDSRPENSRFDWEVQANHRNGLIRKKIWLQKDRNLPSAILHECLSDIIKQRFPPVFYVHLLPYQTEGQIFFEDERSAQKFSDADALSFEIEKVPIIVLKENPSDSISPTSTVRTESWGVQLFGVPERANVRAEIHEVVSKMGEICDLQISKSSTGRSSIGSLEVYCKEVWRKLVLDDCIKLKRNGDEDTITLKMTEDSRERAECFSIFVCCKDFSNDIPLEKEDLKETFTFAPVFSVQFIRPRKTSAVVIFESMPAQRVAAQFRYPHYRLTKSGVGITVKLAKWQRVV